MFKEGDEVVYIEDSMLIYDTIESVYDNGSRCMLVKDSYFHYTGEIALNPITLREEL